MWVITKGVFGELDEPKLDPDAEYVSRAKNSCRAVEIGPFDDRTNAYALPEESRLLFEHRGE